MQKRVGPGWLALFFSFSFRLVISATAPRYPTFFWETGGRLQVMAVWPSEPLKDPNGLVNVTGGAADPGVTESLSHPCSMSVLFAHSHAPHATFLLNVSR